jgi:hypothetical protein
MKATFTFECLTTLQQFNILGNVKVAIAVATTAGSAPESRQAAHRQVVERAGWLACRRNRAPAPVSSTPVAVVRPPQRRSSE